MKHDPAFATSPICVTDKDYELAVVPEGYVMDEETARDFLACNER